MFSHWAILKTVSTGRLPVFTDEPTTPSIVCLPGVLS